MAISRHKILIIGGRGFPQQHPAKKMTSVTIFAKSIIIYRYRTFDVSLYNKEIMFETTILQIIKEIEVTLYILLLPVLNVIEPIQKPKHAVPANMDSTFSISGAWVISCSELKGTVQSALPDSGNTNMGVMFLVTSLFY